jgi:hypothetical protein
MDSKRKTVRCLFACALASAAALCMPAGATAAVWKPFAPTSPWNVPTAQKGGTTPNPYTSQFTSYMPTLEISGIAPDGRYAKPIFFAQPGDPEYVWRNLNGWGKGDIRYQGEPIPLPAGAQQAGGSDGHLTIVTADRRYAYDMWRADVATKSAAVIVRFDLAGEGVPGVRANATSARGSGAPIIPTTIRAEEAVNGIDHALGLTIPQASSSYIYPATHTDGDLGPDAVQYGMLFVLRADYPLPAGASLGERNIIRALQTYGAYVVDQGSTMGLDADSTHAELWQQAGMYGKSSMPIRASDWRLVNVGTPPDPAPAPSPEPVTDPGRSGRPCTKKRHRKHECRLVEISVSGARASRVGSAVRVRGKVNAAAAGSRRARLQIKTRKGWKTVATAKIRADGTFALRLPRRKWHRKVRLRAVVRGVGKSRTQRVRL